jgi:hypothetical protein
MTAQRQKSFGSKSLIALALMSVVGVNLAAATAHAEDCLAAPNSPAREGTRWYYRLDRATQHKCWYMRALDHPTQQVVAPTKTALRAPAFAIPIPRPRPSTAGSALSLSRSDPGPSSSYPDEIATKASAAPPVSGSSAETTSSIPKEFTSQQTGASLAAPGPNAAPLIGAATDETTSAISEMHQPAPSPRTIAAATAAAPDAKTLADATTDETISPTSDIAAPQQVASSSEPNAQVAASGPNAAPPINAPIDDAASSIPKDSATQPSTSSDLSSNDAELAPDVSLAEHQAPPAVAMLNARPIRPDLLFHGRERIALTDEPIDTAWMWVKPLYLIVAFLLTLVVMLYYVGFRYFVEGSAQMSDGHPDDDGIDDQYNNPEFYRKLRQGGALEKARTSKEMFAK